MPNLRGGSRVIPADRQPTPRKGEQHVHQRQAHLTREPARNITMLDYEGSPLKSDSNEVSVENIKQLREPQRLTIDLVEELGADA